MYFGFDWYGIVCVVWYVIIFGGDKGFGGFIIIQQVVCNFFLSLEKFYLCKFIEIFIVVRMENEFIKDQIFELYFNKMFFGYCFYGVVVVVEYYYGKMFDQFMIVECVIIVFIFQLFLVVNFINNLVCMLVWCNWVLGQMLEYCYISKVEYEQVVKEFNGVFVYEQLIEVDVFYLVEMVCCQVFDCLGNDVFIEGYVVKIIVQSS